MSMPGAGDSRGWVRGPQDALAGVIVILISAAILHALSSITTTSYQAFSPALFPRLCTYAIMLGGAVLIGRGLLRDGPGLPALPLRPAALVTLAVVVFGFVSPRLGYAVGGLLTLVIGGLAASDLRLRELLLVSVALIAVSVVLFSYVLKLSIPILLLPGLSL
jgi:putative tricarboxylic transport membrane protein